MVQRKVLISLPEELLREADEVARHKGLNRSEFVREAMQLCIRQWHRMNMREQMIRGYEEMALINQEWSEASLYAENMSSEAYEALLAERE